MWWSSGELKELEEVHHLTKSNSVKGIKNDYQLMERCNGGGEV